jgi:hypothetical protein
MGMLNLRDAMEMMPTPTARDYKDAAYQSTLGKRAETSLYQEQILKEQQTWWEAQSDILWKCPNGISYELDKDRSNRIKALGNSISTFDS